eukprot:gene12442-12579_t
MLQSLQQLSHLTLSSCDLSVEALQQVSSLQQLQHLVVLGNQLQPASPAGVEASTLTLPPSLTLLDISMNSRYWDVTSVLASNPLPALRHLSLDGMIVNDPEALTCFQNLTYLSAGDCTVSRPSQLLAAVKQLSGLQHLHLPASLTSDGGDWNMADLDGCLAQLTLLTFLDLSLNMWLLAHPAAEDAPVQNHPSILRSDSSPGLPDLEVLLMTEGVMQPSQTASYDDGIGLRHLVVKCPNLRQLWLSGFQYMNCTAADIASLKELSNLTSLVVGGLGMGFQDVHLKSFAELTALKHLSLVPRCNFTDVGLLPLTQLTQLTCLTVALDDGSKRPQRLRVALAAGLMLHPPRKSKRQGDPVWQQLLKLCKTSVSCLHVIIKDLEGDLQATRQEVAALQGRRAAAAEHHAAAVQHEIEQLRQKLQLLH